MVSIRFAILVVLLLVYPQNAKALPAVDLLESLPLIETAGQLLCDFHLKAIYVYFENSTSLGYSSHLLRILSECNISYYTMRNKFRTKRLHVINDDYILMYLVMIQRNASQPLEMSIIRKKSAAKHVSYVLVLIEDSELVTPKWLHHTFAQFWKVWMMNVVILFWREHRLHVYRYNPFADSDYVIEVLYRGIRPEHDELYPKTLPDMKGRPLRICMYADEIRAVFKSDGDMGGADGYMATFIAERLNATRVMHRLSFADANNKTDEICFQEIRRGIDDIALNIRFLAQKTSNVYRYVESTIVHVRDDLCVLVPKADITTTFWNLFRPFTAWVWLLVVGSVPLALIACVTLYGRSYLRSHFAMQLYASLLFMPFTQMPPRHSVRMFICFWLFYAVLIGNAFKGNLTSNLVLRKYLPDINSIEDLAHSPYKLLLFARHEKHLNNFLDPSKAAEAIVKQKMRVTPVRRLLELIKRNNVSYAYLQKAHVAKHQSNSREHTRNGRPLYHVMATCLVPFHAVFILPYGSPLVGFVNLLIRSSHEYGYYVYWDTLTNHAIHIRSARNAWRSQNYNRNLVVLRLDHFIAAFCLLVVGLSTALLVFLWELKC